MNSARNIPVLFLLILLLLSGLLKGQNIPIPSKEQEVQTTGDSTVITPIALTDIPVATDQSFTRVRELSRKRLSQEEKDGMVSEVDTILHTCNEFLDDTLKTSVEMVNSRELQHMLNRADILAKQLTDIQDKLGRKSTSTEAAIVEMSDLQKRWKLTREKATEEEVPAALMERIDQIIYGIDSVTALMRSDLEFLVEQQNRLSDEGIRLNLFHDKVRNELDYLGARIFERDMPGFFKVLPELKKSGIIKDHFIQIRDAIKSDARVIGSQFRKPFILIIFFFLLLLGFTTWYRINYKRLIITEEVEEQKFHLILIRAPLLTTLFITTLFVRFAYPDLPHTFSALNLMIMMVPTLVLLSRMFHQHIRYWFLLVAAIFVLTFIYEFLFYPDVVLRIILMIYSISGVIIFSWILFVRPIRDSVKNRLIYKSLRFLVYSFTGLLVAAVIGNLVGAFRMAEFFTLAPIKIFIAAVAIFITTKVAGAVVYLVLISQALHRLHVISDDFQVIYKKVTRVVNLILWLIFVSDALRIFRVKDAVFQWGRSLLSTGRNIGELDITLASILIFIFVIWLSIIISRTITRILEKDVFVRVSMAKGVPNTINMLLKVVLITVGFFVAAAAAGMKLTNLSIILGAFSVGIGFGLQNIFNNMVSGLILAFERPIKVGDIVQVGELMGTVLSIGLRSSIVRSFDGAEVIVPNGNLISDQMINWTRSDSNRRMDIRVGVAYGTDPEKVLAILEQVANEHKMVDKKLTPRAYFIGFGDSSLDFRLLAWTEIDHRLPVESELNVTINKKLAEAGIEIPFPQRDLHIRSDDTKESK